MGNVIIINKEIMGQGSEELGRIILSSFFKKITTYASQIDAIIFYNSGVKLLSKESQYLTDLELVNKSGIELIACGTCISFYKLNGKTALGRTSDMLEIVQILTKAEKVITL